MSAVPSLSTIAVVVRALVRHALSNRRDLHLLLGIALGMNGLLWGIRLVWFSFNPLIAVFGTLLWLLNVALALLFSKKEVVLSQSIAVTAIVLEALILILIIRTGAVGLSGIYD